MFGVVLIQKVIELAQAFPLEHRSVEIPPTANLEHSWLKCRDFYRKFYVTSCAVCITFRSIFCRLLVMKAVINYYFIMEYDRKSTSS